MKIATMDPTGNAPRTHWIAPSATTTTAAATTATVSSSSSSYCYDINCLCLGTGRFLRSVLVPAVTHAGYRPALVQPRGRTFLDGVVRQTASSPSSSTTTYPVDTVLPSGDIHTDEIPVYGAFSLGQAADKQAFYDCLPHMKPIAIVGVGVTEAGLASAQTQAMKDLYDLLKHFCRLLLSSSSKENETVWKITDIETPRHKICVIDMDNIPNNGQLLYQHMQTLAKQDSGKDDDTTMTTFLNERVVFFDTMVDRITSQRDGSAGWIPRAEPVPAKALVVLDIDGLDLPRVFSTLSAPCGVVVRTTAAQLQADLALKLRIANGTHTAIAHCLALLKYTQTDCLSQAQDEAARTIFMNYLDNLVEHQILPAWLMHQATAGGTPQQQDRANQEAQDVYTDWRRRLLHPHFGLSTFFITQNGPAKGGIRLGPTVQDLLQHDQTVTVAMAFAFAVLLRWLTPGTKDNHDTTGSMTTAAGVYTGWLPTSDNESGRRVPFSNETIEYADNMRYNLAEGWYEFRCACKVNDQQGSEVNLSDWLAGLKRPNQPVAYVDIIRAYLLSPEGGNLGSVADKLNVLTQAVATLYARMVAGDDLMSILNEFDGRQAPYTNGMATDCAVLVDGASLDHGRPLHYRVSPIPNDSKLLTVPIDLQTVESVVIAEVASALAIDLHTHLLPPSHGSLCLWGIDELLTYHYLVAEYFMTAPSDMTPDEFYAKTKREQADIIWQALFIDRSPVSEACRGVITTLMSLGLVDEVESRNLENVRAFYRGYRNRGLQGAEEFSRIIHSLAGVRYNVMTNIPFSPEEAHYWRPKRQPYPEQYRSALRVDPLLTGDRRVIETALKASGYEASLEGARQYLRDWCETMKPEYMMASTPHDLVRREGTLASAGQKGMNEEALQQPGAFVEVTNASVACSGMEDEVPSLINESSDFLSDVLMKVCEERDLPLALKIGAHRGVNPALKTAGDGMVAFADAGILGRLCSRFPKVRFLATFLSRNNQHEACVLASKFRNLHIYGCWWFCNNPSLIKEITQMRVEMLGTGFTAQHSDARVLDQLAYKWPHSRAVIADVLRHEFAKLVVSGWKPTRSEIKRDVARLFGESYEEFMAKSLL